MKKPDAIRAARRMAKEHSCPIVVFSHTDDNYDLCAQKHFNELLVHHSSVMRELMIMPNGTVVQ